MSKTLFNSQHKSSELKSVSHEYLLLLKLLN